MITDERSLEPIANRLGVFVFTVSGSEIHRSPEDPGVPVSDVNRLCRNKIKGPQFNLPTSFSPRRRRRVVFQEAQYEQIISRYNFVVRPVVERCSHVNKCF